jgi:hypothetical protein
MNSLFMGSHAQATCWSTPANFVAKQWEQRETDFLEKTYQEMSADIRGSVAA